jgi:hypothetical protein
MTAQEKGWNNLTMGNCWWFAVAHHGEQQFVHSLSLILKTSRQRQYMYIHIKLIDE